MMFKIFLTISTAVALTACASIKSVKSPQAKSDFVDGLTYFMPKKDILVTITIEKDKITNVALGVTAAYPDLSTQYVLRHDGNAFGKNTLDVIVSESGLLTSAKSTTKSHVTEAFKNLTTSVVNLEMTKLMKAIDQEVCADGTHSFIYPAANRCFDGGCGMAITIVRKGDIENIAPHLKDENAEHSGVFYRQNIPYLVTATLVTATGNRLSVASIVFSPSESKTHFLPVSKTFFSNNEADFVFSDGVPTQYKQDTDGEVVALFKLPADIIGAYFEAIGSVFDNFKTTDQKEAAALAESLKLELAKKKYDACIAAIQAEKPELVEELGCQ